jgi:hypothetical protein
VDLVTYAIGDEVAIPGVRVRRAPSLPFLRRVKVGPSLATFPLDALVFVRALGLLARHRYDCVNTHEEVGLFAVLFKKVFRTRLLHDMHSSLSEQLALRRSRGAACCTARCAGRSGRSCATPTA